MHVTLNPALFAAVQRKIGPAKIISENVELEGFYYNDVRHGNRRCLKINRRGETILVDCPFCNDRRARMSINHRYGVIDEETGSRGTNLWKCYNEECQNKSDNRDALRDKLLPEIDLPMGGPVFRTPGIRRVAPTGLEPVEFPGLIIPLKDLTPGHHAAAYLERRNFDLTELTDVWGVGYAESMPMRREGAMSSDRIIIPVRFRGVMIGWQSRFIGDIDWKTTGIPKYLTYFPKSQAIYGFDEAKSSDVIVIVEGASDVWRYGPGAVCGFGKKLSNDQVRLIVELTENSRKPIVMIPDANDKEAFDNFCAGMSQILDAGFSGHYGLVPLPRGKDPGSMTRPVLRAMVAHAAKSVPNKTT